ncbi:LAME_0G16006g1_1 [Lachancea meyersii CBS 8951]|uniref:F-actin-capping protein subunit alpha n=1 Tax=Lachancea meyersii CBS 8951 TaxID=1266667 RepID=A0A1G4KB57_9SACH|nr:LAME_0G16006g1_1 [Lachancea meyersii CBS 8951]
MASEFNNIIHSLIASTPSGEIKDVYKNLLVIAGEQAEDTILDSIAKYNVTNFIPIQVEGRSVIISNYNKEGSKFFDPVSSRLFSVNHLDRTAFDVNSCEKKLCETSESIHQDLESYTSKTFPGNVSYAVYPGDAPHDIVIAIVSTKYSPGNFWNGHWKSVYHYNLDTKQLKGVIDVNVHYYENGNVSFQCEKQVEDQSASNAVVSIKTLENELEKEMRASFTNLNEKEFKLLRRRLPVTRSKINWGKGVGTYRLGKDSAENQFR